MPGTSKISDYVGLRIPKPIVAAMNRIIKTYDPPIPLSRWMIQVLAEAVSKVDFTANPAVMVTTPKTEAVTTPNIPESKKVTTPKYLDKYAHGTSGYGHGCRCDICRKSHSDRIKKQRNARHVEGGKCLVIA